MLPREEIKEKAKKNLKNKWIPVTLTLFVIGLFPILLEVIISIIVSPLLAQIEEIMTEILIVFSEQINPNQQYLLSLADGIVNLSNKIRLWELLGIIGTLFEMCFTLSLFNMFITVAKDKDYKFRDIKGFFRNIKASFCLNFVMTLKIFLWSLLFIIPGIIKYFSYVMANHIRIKRPEFTANQCLKASEEMMRGRKMDYFVFALSFIGWYLLGILTCMLITNLTAPLLSITSGILNYLCLFVVEVVCFALLLPVEAYFGVAETHYYYEILKDKKLNELGHSEQFDEFMKNFELYNKEKQNAEQEKQNVEQENTPFEEFESNQD